MTDYVARDDVLALQTELHIDTIPELKYWRCRHIDPHSVLLLPAADVRHVMRGEWMKVDKIHYCSVCGKCFPYKTDFCPNCGADMRKESGGQRNER